jgi:methylmalonyl-CoA mutase
VINGFKLQQTGATTWQENAFCLNAGHEYILELMNDGFTIDEAAACVSFHIGIGSNYFYEIAKIRAFKQLWSKIIAAYHPEHACSHNCSITAVLGHLNKSLQDPHTNLLRQTTEAMSALSGGVDQIVILPYDFYSTTSASELSERMAVNIPLILKEESYFDIVIDPVGGSYSLEQLTEKIGRKTWSEFQRIEQDGGLLDESARDQFSTRVNTKRTARIEHFKNDKQLLIGINKYLNPEKIEQSWQTLPSYLGNEGLNFELVAKNDSI